MIKTNEEALEKFRKTLKEFMEFQKKHSGGLTIFEAVEVMSQHNAYEAKLKMMKEILGLSEEEVKKIKEEIQKTCF